MLPALERRPATEAVARMEPEGWCFEGEVWSMAAEACLVAMKTLVGGSGVSYLTCLSMGWALEC